MTKMIDYLRKGNASNSSKHDIKKKETRRKRKTVRTRPSVVMVRFKWR